MRPGLLRDGYRLLAREVLLDAAARLAKSNPECRPKSVVERHAREARAWFEDRDDTRPLSFEWICHGLGIAPGPARRAALEGKLTSMALARGSR